MNVSLLIIAVVATITSAQAQYTDPVCPNDKEQWCAVKCNVQVDAPICVYPKAGCKGSPITLRNRCVLNGYNCGCRSYPLEFLHDGVC